MLSQPRTWRIAAIAVAMLALALLAITPALAAEVVSGNNVVIDDDVDDDLYIFADDIVIDATVDGDVIAFGNSLTVNGTITGDLMFGGQWLVINGTVEDDARIAGAVLVMEDGAVVGDDVNVGGAAFEMKPGSTIGGDLFAGGNQVAIADVAGDVAVGAQGVAINGTIGGNADLTVSSQDIPFANPLEFMDNLDLPTVSTVGAGIDFGGDGLIDGDLTYYTDRDLNLPTDNVGGDLNYEYVAAPSFSGPAPTGEDVGGFFAVRTVLGYVGYLVTSLILLVVLGLILQAAFPQFTGNAMTALRERFWASLGLGFLGYLIVFILIPILIAIAFLVIVLPLPGVSARLGGMLSLTGGGLFMFFRFVTRWVGPVLVGALVGNALFRNRDQDKVTFLPLTVGVLILVIRWRFRWWAVCCSDGSWGCSVSARYGWPCGWGVRESAKRLRRHSACCITTTRHRPGG